MLNDFGFIIVNTTDFTRCFDIHEIGHYREKEGYDLTWYDKLNDSIFTFNSEFFFTPKSKDGDIYINVETYYPQMVPSTCNWNIMPHVTFKVFNGN